MSKSTLKFLVRSEQEVLSLDVSLYSFFSHAANVATDTLNFG